MQVLLSAAASPGCRYHRVQEPARAVNEADLGVSATVSRGLATTMVPRPGSDELDVVAVDARGADVVVLQLPTTLQMLQCLRLLQAQGVAVVVEVDDLLSELPAGHRAFAGVKNGRARWISECAREADLVTVTAPGLLATYAAHGRGVVVANAVPRRIAELPPAYERDPAVVSIGWAGSLVSRSHDMLAVGSGVRQALDRAGDRAQFVVLGQAGTAREQLGLAGDPVEVAWQDSVDEYGRVLGEVLDVGIAPLRDDRFNSAKSWLKVLEYAARGMYAIHSPSPEYDRLALGRRARTARDWARWLSVAVEDGDRRREKAEQDRAEVLRRHLTEHRAQTWAAAWVQARDNRRASMRRGA